MKKIKDLTWMSIAATIMIMASSATAYAQKPTKLTDPEIASAAVVANQGDIGFAKIAEEKSKNTEVLKFAKLMATDHQSVIDQAVALVTKLNVTPKDNALSKKLTADAAKTRKMLLSQSAKTFDKAYVDNEVAYHKGVISAIETVLVPQSTNPELKSLLENVIPTFKAHLAHAEMVQKMFAGK